MSAKHKNISDEIREQNKKFKEMSPKQKLAYFWEYYRVPTIVIIGAVLLTVSMVRSMIENSKDTLLYAAFINGTSTLDYSEMEQGFADVLGVDLNDVFITIDSSFQLSTELNSTADIAGTQKLMAMSASNQLDILAADEEVAMYMAGNGYYLDLRTILPPELLRKYEPYFVYYTYDPVKVKADMEAAGIPYEEDSQGPYDTLRPVPIGISSEALSDFVSKIYYGMPSVVGVCTSSKNVENAIEFITFLENYQN